MFNKLFSDKRFISAQDFAEIMKQKDPSRTEQKQSVEQEPLITYSLQTGQELVSSLEKETDGDPCQDGGVSDPRAGFICACDGIGSGGASEQTVQAVTNALRSLLNPTSPDAKLLPFFSSDPSLTTATEAEAIAAGKTFFEELNLVAYQTRISDAALRRCEEATKKKHMYRPLSPEAFQEALEASVDASKTTITFAKIFQTPDGAPKALIGNIGDSRIYRRRNKEWSIVSRDHGIAQTLIELKVVKNDLDNQSNITEQQMHDLATKEQQKQTELSVRTPPASEREMVTCESHLKALGTLLKLFRLRHLDPTITTPDVVNLHDVSYEVLAAIGSYDLPDTSRVYTVDVEEGDEFYAFTDGVFEVLTSGELEEERTNKTPKDMQTVCRAIQQAISAKCFFDDTAKDDDRFVAALQVSLKKRLIPAATTP